VVPLVLASMGQWALAFRGGHQTLIGGWVAGRGCMVTEADNNLLAIVPTYTMALAFIVLLLSAFKLFVDGKTQRHFMKRLFEDGLIYFVIAFVVNLMASIISLLNLSPIMSLNANIPAGVISAIAACRLIRRLGLVHSDRPKDYSWMKNLSRIFESSKASDKPGSGERKKETTQRGPEKSFVVFDPTPRDDPESQHSSNAQMSSMDSIPC